MNNKGFISMYALMILSIILAFINMFAQSVQTFVNTHTSNQTEFIDIYIIKNVQKELQHKKEDKQEDEKEDETNVKHKKKEDNSTILTEYKGIPIQFHIEDTFALVDYTYKGVYHKITIPYDSKSNSILDYVYM